jgi:hypothetical protein
MGVTMVMSAGVAWTLAKTTAWDRPGRVSLFSMPPEYFREIGILPMP